MLTIFDIAINDELGFWANLITKLNYLRNQLIMGVHFTHFFFGTKMHGECGRVLSKKSWQPLMKFFHFTPPKPSFYRYG